MSFLIWLNEHLTLSRKRSDFHDAMRTSDELLETKRSLVRFTQDLNDGRLSEQHKVVRIKTNVLEDTYRGGNREDRS